jgi:hypothetical protein
MTVRPSSIPRLIDLCPEYREKMVEYARLCEIDLNLADMIFREAQIIASEFRKKAAQ